jgi:uncharacterized cupin superfamily protein
MSFCTKQWRLRICGEPMVRYSDVIRQDETKQSCKMWKPAPGEWTDIQLHTVVQGAGYEYGYQKE